jgi:MFS family permease
MVMFVCGLALFLASAYQTSIVTILPSMQRDLHTSLNWATWTITIFALGTVIVFPVTGRLADQFGRKRLLLFALVIFALSSLAAYFAANIAELIALRLVQSVGSGAVLPCCTGIAAEAFPGNRDRVVGMFSSIMPAGGLIGPLIGGAAVAVGSWRYVFLVPTPLIALVIAAGARYLPRTPVAPHVTRTVDVRGIATLAGTLVAAMLGVTLLGQPGGVAPAEITVSAVALVLALAAGTAFMRHTRGAEHPVIPYDLLVGRQPASLNAVNTVFGAAAMGLGSLLPLYAQLRYGLSAFQAGTVLTARALGMMCIAGVAAFALRRTGYKTPIIIGYVVLAAASAALWAAPALGASAYVWVAVTSGLAGLGMGTASPALNNAALRLAPEQISAVTGLRAMFRAIGSIVAVSLVSAVVAASSAQGRALALSYLCCAVIFLATLPLIARLHDQRGSW